MVKNWCFMGKNWCFGMKNNRIYGEKWPKLDFRPIFPTVEAINSESHRKVVL